MRVVGVDLGLGQTGVATVDGTVLLRPGRRTGPDRLCWLRDAVLDIALGFGGRLGHDVLVAVEGYSYGSKGRSVFDIGELGGVVRAALWDAGASLLVVPPSTVKKYATGSGTKAKEFVWEACRKRAGEEVVSLDEADAWWIRQIGLRLVEPDAPDLVYVPDAHVAALVGLPPIVRPGPVSVLA